MLEFLKLNLQLFADGGDGGDAGDGAGDSDSGDSSMLDASIPEKAKGNFKKAMEKMRATSNPKRENFASQTTNGNVPGEVQQNAKAAHIPYSELIKSDEYKEEHQAYMDKTISDRLKKYKDMEGQYNNVRGALDLVAQKYGIDSNSTSFLDDLSKAIEDDDTFYEQYAIDHDMSTEEAKHVLQLESKVKKAEAEKAERDRQAEMDRQIAILQQNAMKTKNRFPDFNLQAEMQNEKFRRLCAINNGDTTAAFIACHYDQIIPATVHMAAQQAQQQTANAIASNVARPAEAGLSTSSPSLVSEDFSKMNLQQLRAYADQQRRAMARRK